ncbi:hypothetical protein K488DRAFT_80507 [Vararia minispora EC-137]|uniref:Uncharacterized protein n=1 Tax=Vararia minispora EC-137 TaxID=1314806 RepID=A0ACB8QB59_9AGAM|nr:hypothetical protein K488DRAFT_80507 [Vararia minispora EC-137]
MTTNPSHILIARNSRGTHNPSASLSSPTETHAAAAGIFRSTGSPPWHLEGIDTDDVISDLSTDEGQEPIDVDEAFTRCSEFPGTVKIIVEATTFWAHKEILYFASPFFQAALSGDWAETGRPASMSSVITISQPPSVPGDKPRVASTEVTFAPVNSDLGPDEFIDSDVDGEGSSTGATAGAAHDEEKSGAETSGENKRERVVRKETARLQSLDKLQGRSERTLVDSTKPTETVKPALKRTIGASSHIRRKSTAPSAVIVLKEEKAGFPCQMRLTKCRMECTISWNNVEGLMNISHKLCAPSLTRICLNFLLTHAAGRPIKAMRIAELFEEEELYREGSRFVLDNPGGWPEQEMSTLSPETLLKLEKRRTWFLERVLKLGLVQIAKEYECCSSCPDPSNCARLVEEKWRQAYQAVFRFGPCQPSMVFRYLRSLEGVSPPLALTHLSCQMTAKAFIATLFDRMFSLGVRGSGTDTAPLGARVAAVAGVASATLPRRHFLYCSLKPENPAPRNARNRETS